MECFGGDVNRMVYGMEWSGVDWVVDGLGLWLVGLGRVKSGLRRLCVVCATTQNCCKCNNFIQIHAPQLVITNSADNTC